MPENLHICVCICTYRRPALLGRLLSRIETQRTGGLFDYSVVVVDNDRSESARQVVESFARSSQIPVHYDVEPEQSISLARNRAVRNAGGDLVGFIDDDEVPAENWLLHHVDTLHRCGADGVLGPVLPCFETAPPDWVLKGRFFDRPTHRTGEVLEWRNTRTGNALLRKTLFPDGRSWFDPAFGSGGEDRDFFRKAIASGSVFVWCEEAPVYEAVPPDRWKRSVMMKRALLRGKVAFENRSSPPFDLLKSAAAIAVYLAGMPLFLILGQHVFMAYLVRTCDHLGKLLALMGIDLVKEKYVTG
jgi:glycosyltransferase involved in cell wall biosynthesis